MKVLYGVAVLVAAVLSGCGGGGDSYGGGSSQSAEQQCSAIGAYFCASAQANLQPPGGFQDGSLGFCMVAAQGFNGLVGYSATTFNGGAFPVTTQSAANDNCNLVNQGGQRNCPGYSRCTRSS